MTWIKTLLLKIVGFAKAVVDWLLSPAGREVLDWATKLLPIVISALRESGNWREVALYHAQREITRSKERVPREYDIASVRKAAVQADLPNLPTTDGILRAAIEIAAQMHAQQEGRA